MNPKNSCLFGTYDFQIPNFLRELGSFKPTSHLQTGFSGGFPVTYQVRETMLSFACIPHHII